jgi:sporulation-control protein spo0M
LTNVITAIERTHIQFRRVDGISGLEKKSMTVNPNTTVNELMCQFAEHFPFLRLALYEGMGNKKRAASENEYVLKFGTNSVEVIFESSTKVRDFIDYLEKLLGWKVQILRSSGKLYIETSVTDQWTLDRQNQEGAELSSNL